MLCFPEVQGVRQNQTLLDGHSATELWNGTPSMSHSPNLKSSPHHKLILEHFMMPTSLAVHGWALGTVRAAALQMYRRMHEHCSPKLLLGEEFLGSAMKNCQDVSGSGYINWQGVRISLPLHQHLSLLIFMLATPMVRRVGW